MVDLLDMGVTMNEKINILNDRLMRNGELSKEALGKELIAFLKMSDLLQMKLIILEGKMEALETKLDTTVKLLEKATSKASSITNINNKYESN